MDKTLAWCSSPSDDTFLPFTSNAASYVRCSIDVLLRSVGNRCTEETGGVCFPDLGGLRLAPGSRPAAQLTVVTIIRRDQRFKISRANLNRISEGILRGNLIQILTASPRGVKRSKFIVGKINQTNSRRCRRRLYAGPFQSREALLQILELKKKNVLLRR